MEAIGWAHQAGTVLAAFLASLIELAVGTVRGGAPALLPHGARLDARRSRRTAT